MRYEQRIRTRAGGTAGSLGGTVAITQRIPRPVGMDAILGAAGLVMGLVIVVVGNYNVHADENGGTGPAIFSAIVCVVVAAAIFGFVLPRVQNVERSTLILGIVAFVSLVVFWLGVAPIIGAAALAVARRVATPSAKIRAGQILGALGALVAFIATLAQNV